MTQRGIDSLRREYDTLINAGLGQTHEWLDTEDDILKKCPLLPRENIKVREAQRKIHDSELSYGKKY